MGWKCGARNRNGRRKSLVCGGGVRGACGVSYRERSCTVLMKKAVQLDGEPSVSVSPEGGSLLHFTLSMQKKMRVHINPSCATATSYRAVRLGQHGHANLICRMMCARTYTCFISVPHSYRVFFASPWWRTLVLTVHSSEKAFFAPEGAGQQNASGSQD